ncbi:hypothetical protein [Scytonema sp. NUACC26]|uniref:hypothetical protein n=1 Tax=Scytonema sp. NUACC26 TaxID=3140176 RepID=UPI0038B2C895
MQNISIPSRGDVWLVDLGYTANVRSLTEKYCKPNNSSTLQPTKISGSVLYLEAVLNFLEQVWTRSNTPDKFTPISSDVEEYSEPGQPHENQRCGSCRHASSCCNTPNGNSSERCTTNRHASVESLPHT